MKEDVVLSLNLSRDAVARSIAYLYLHAHGAEAGCLDTKEIARLAQALSEERAARQLAGEPPDFYTASQTWAMCKAASQPLIDEPANATLGELEACLGAVGFRIAGVVLRTIPEDEREAHGDALHRLRERSEVLME